MAEIYRLVFEGNNDFKRILIRRRIVFISHSDYNNHLLYLGSFYLLSMRGRI